MSNEITLTKEEQDVIAALSLYAMRSQAQLATLTGLGDRLYPALLRLEQAGVIAREDLSYSRRRYRLTRKADTLH